MKSFQELAYGMSNTEFIKHLYDCSVHVMHNFNCVSITFKAIFYEKNSFRPLFCSADHFVLEYNFLQNG